MSCNYKIGKRWILFTLFPVGITYVFVPLSIYLFPAIMHHVFFLNFVKVPFRDYSNLSAFGVLMHGRNFYLTGIDGVRLGCWHMLPKTISEKLGEHPTEIDVENSLSEPGYSVVIYLHGNALDRTTAHRIQLYNVLTLLDFHVIALDYRGYGDSSGFPTEIGLIEDSKVVIEYARKFAPKNSMFVWGHSMGTGVATATIMELGNHASTGLVLEAPFNNLHDVIYNHPLARPFRWLPRFEDILIKPLQASGLNMSSDVRIKRINCPILILHAADDNIIPVKLGRRLRDAALQAHRDVKYIEFEAHRGFQHKFIHLAKEMPSLFL